MFHQIRIREEDKQSQRFLWRDNPADPAQIFIMDVATFGATCSPCIAQFVKNENARAYIESYPRAVQGIIENHYVDDFLDSTDTIQEAIQLVQEVKNIHAAAGFEIGKFLSNSPEVLNALSESQRGSSKCMNLDKQVDTERVLGLTWVPSSDVFTFDTATKSHIRNLIENRSIPTKRQVLRTVMTLFDPLGFIAHFVVHGKVLMQDIWRSGTDWDVPIDDRLQDRWLRWSELIEHLENVKVPRCFFRKTNFRPTDNIQLHIFVDASEIAYACVGYLRFDDGVRRQCTLVAAKTKVAPLKALSIPRLELQAAMIGARLAQAISQSLTVTVNQRFLWSDSSTVLAWLRSDSRKYHPFVAFRIGEILSITSIDEWRHVPSKINVADDATKWGDGPSFKPEDRWFSGPDFLFEPEYRWPSNAKESTTTHEELRAVYVHHNKFSSPLIDVSRFSNWNRMLRATAYVHRAVNIMLKRVSKAENFTLLSGDLQRAEVTLWRQVQTQVYSDEVVELNVGANHTVNKSSPLYKLSPFLDELGIIRMGSRIGAAPQAPYAAKYPIILPKDHLITFLLTDSFHRRFLHANGETVFNEMRQLFYISNLRSLIRRVTKECQLCKVKKAQPMPPMMAPLPKIRLTPFIRPFTYVGVDYFGPLEVKVGRSIVKRWAVLFTCLTIRAVHMEVAHTLSSRSCIMAFRRFIARRGAPAEVYTDNGTNFVGASRQLNEEIQQQKTIAHDCATTFTNAHTAWFFNPPAAPHMGGAWERMVRSIKTAMKSISECTRHPSDEVLETVLLEAEAIVNSRPLTYIPLETADQEALTPNHFLLYGSSGVKQPPTVLGNSVSALRDSWKLTQLMVDEFWRRWVREYMPMLTRRTKWFEPVKPLEPGDLVVVMDQNSRNSWERGRVLSIVRGAGGQTRRATVQTARGVISRPATNLAVLDVGKVRGIESSVAAGSIGVLHGPGDVTRTTDK
ncbi:uncharacterized protein LOC129771880 [Toxorhynchites rutilus septentrionalis]|uniref:uncharacterized protein LOC129771880 n=1 Tax=Toxorhynchites rutilus septentrionalis TaxID=329112 RepID=UPI002478C164|nr:uncharacterized protein LOC129771880 [Toxorhynchites rutilus septentrionalis]